MIVRIIEQFDERKKIVKALGKECLEWNFTLLDGTDREIECLPYTKKEWEKAVEEYDDQSLNAMIWWWGKQYEEMVKKEEFKILSKSNQISEDFRDEMYWENWDFETAKHFWEKHSINRLNTELENMNIDIQNTSELGDLSSRVTKHSEGTYGALIIQNELHEKRLNQGDYNIILKTDAELIKKADKFNPKEDIEFIRIYARNRYMIALHEKGERTKATKAAKDLLDNIAPLKEEEPVLFFTMANNALLVISNTDLNNAIARYRTALDKEKVELDMLPGLKAHFLLNCGICILNEAINRFNKNISFDSEGMLKASLEYLEEAKSILEGNVSLDIYNMSDRDPCYFKVLIAMVDIYSRLKKISKRKKKIIDLIYLAKETWRDMDSTNCLEWEEERKKINQFFDEYILKEGLSLLN